MKHVWILFFLLVPLKGHAGVQSVDQSVAVSGGYGSYSALGGLDTTRPALGPIHYVDISYAIHSIFELTLMGGKTFQEKVDPTSSKADIRQIIGLGFRVGLPGFFFFGAKSYDLLRPGRRYPVQSYVSVLALRVSRQDTSSSAVSKDSGNQIGLGMDIFLFQPRVFLNTEAAFYTVEGDASLAAKVGLGFVF